jgi:pimeloyl-ACP methyl ester carboxylesterase
MVNRGAVVIACARATLVVLALPITVIACASAARVSSAPSSAPTDRPTNATPARPKVLVATAPDGTRIAYDTEGTGPALILVHGGGQTRQSWKSGYVDRLSKRFTVISVDLRGSGDSDKPMTEKAYALDAILADLLAVADAAGAARFHVWGFGHGATISRYLAARSDRVMAAVLVGTTMGPTATGIYKEAVTAMRAKWQPLVAAHAAGTLDVKTLSSSDRAAWESGVPVSALALGAMMDYPPLEPAEIKVPTLWLVGSDDSAAENAKSYQDKLSGTSVTLKMLPSMSYSDSFLRIDEVLAQVEPFLLKIPAS